LRAVGLPELIASTQADYEDLAVQLAMDPDRMARLRRTLEQQRMSAPLFNTPLFTTRLELAYASIYARYQQGLPPDHIHIEHELAQCRAQDR
jgi:predicted O-linked N-acetylglucosamine transferase (SPINDLY family)